MLYVKGCLQVISTSPQTILPLKDGLAKTVKEIWGAGKWSPKLGQKTTRHSRLEESSQPLQNMAVGIDVRREPLIAMILDLSRFMLFSNTNVSRLTLRCCHTVSQHELYTKHTLWIMQDSLCKGQFDKYQKPFIFLHSSSRNFLRK